MKHLSTKTPHPSLDIQSEWYANDPPPFFDLAGFQERLDLRAGKNINGESIVKLFWAPFCTTRGFGQEMPAHWVERKPNGEGWQYATVKRYMLKVRLEPETYVNAWDAARYSFHDPETGELWDTGEAPTEYYDHLYTIADHDPLESCCARLFQSYLKTKSGQTVCYGYFRNPNDSDLQRVEKALQEREAKAARDPYAPLTPAEMFRNATRAQDITRDAEVREREQRLAAINEYNKANRWRLVQSRAPLTHLFLGANAPK